MAEANALAPIDTMNQALPNNAAFSARGGSDLFGGRLEPLRQFTQQPALQRALPAIATTTAIGIAAMAYFLTQSAPQTQLYAGMADADKAAVAEALQSSGIAHNIDGSTGALTVDADKVHQARMALAAQGLPKAQPTGDSMISSLPMGSSRAVEGETLRGAREADLARTIEAIDAVQSARVHIAAAEPSLFVREDKPATASVMLTLLHGRTLTDGQVQAIRFLVASSVPGMNAEQVSVIDQRGALLSDTATTSDMKAFQLQTQMEDRFRRALDTLLRPMLGAGNFSVEVHADVDMSESQATRESFPENDRALTREQINRSVSGTVPPAMGIPGALSNEVPQATELQAERAGATAAGPAAGGAGTQSNENSTRAFEVGREVSVTHNPQGRLRRVSVAVALNQGQRALGAADMAKIDALVKGAVGFDAARGDVVAINQRPFIKIEEPVVEFYEQPWFTPLLKQGSAILIALLVFIFIGRPMMRAAKQRKIESAKQQVALETQLLAAIEPPAEIMQEPRNREITLDMIEAAPSYEDRANLVRAFVRQDSERAALVVRQLMQGAAHG